MNKGKCSVVRKERVLYLEETEDDVKKRVMHMDETAHCSIIIPGRLFLISGSADVARRLRDNKKFCFFCTDNDLVYDNFFGDFGPLNLAMVYRYCVKLNRKFDIAAKSQRRVVHYCSTDPHKRVNAAFLCGAYQIIYLHRSSQEAWAILRSRNPYVAFRDAAVGPNNFPLTLRSCLSAVEKANDLKWINFETFSCDEYEFYERVENGDLNWMIPNKILAFCGPHNHSRIENGHPFHSPEVYFEYFRKHGVTDIVRLNKKMYDAAKFTDNGFKHHDLYFLDGSTPSTKIMHDFLKICESATGAIAVHCKAGLGRTGTLIGCYMIKHFKLSAEESIAWLRICRPGSVIGVQQTWLKLNEVHLQNLLSDRRECRSKEISCDDDTGEATASNEVTQGDHLNQIKASRKPRIKVEL